MKQNQTHFNLGPLTWVHIYDLKYITLGTVQCTPTVHQRNYYKTRQKYASLVSRIAFAVLPIEMRSLIILGLFSLNSFSEAAPRSGTSAH